MTLRTGNGGAAVDHPNSDGVSRHASQPRLADLISEPDFYERDEALMGYYDTPRPANDNGKVHRSAHSARPHHCYNSTSFKYVDVSLPRVSIIDGAFDEAAA